MKNPLAQLWNRRRVGGTAQTSVKMKMRATKPKYDWRKVKKRRQMAKASRKANR